MKVLVLTNLYPNPIQPHRAPWNRAQLRALSARHDVRVVSPILWTDEMSARRQKVVQLPRDRKSTCDGISVEHPRYLYPPKVLRGSYGNCFRWSVGPTFRRAVRQMQPDVVYSSWAYPDAWAAVQLASRARLPVVVKVHGSDITALAQYPARLNRTVQALQRADKVVAVSRSLAADVIKLGVRESNVEVVYNGIDSTIFCPGSRDQARSKLGLPAEPPQILFVGNLVPVKQIETLIGACAALRRAGTVFHCHLIGDGPLRDSLSELIARHDLRECVSLQGPRPQQQLPDWYRAADVVVLPSQSEGIPNVLLEATACGAPFVASNVGGIPEIVADSRSRVVEAGDVRGFTDAIKWSLEHREDRASEMTGFALSWEESAAKLEQVLLTAIRQRNERPTQAATI